MDFHHQAAPLINFPNEFGCFRFFPTVYSTDHLPSFQPSDFPVIAAGQPSHSQHVFFTPHFRFRSFGSPGARRTIASSEARTRKALFQGSAPVEYSPSHWTQWRCCHEEGVQKIQLRRQGRFRSVQQSGNQRNRIYYGCWWQQDRKCRCQPWTQRCSLPVTR